MKPVSDILHKTPWWALIFGGLATFAALAVFVTPYHIIRYNDDGRTEEETRAIKREIDNTFAENAINVGRSVIRGMLARTTDPERRAELEEALQGLEEARIELREAGTEVLRAKREALDAARASTRDVATAVEDARRTLEGVAKEERGQALSDLKAAQAELRRAQRAERRLQKDLEKAQRSATIIVGPSSGDQPMIEIEVDRKGPAAPEPPSPPATPGVDAPQPPPVAQPPAPEATPPSLPPEVARKIRRDVTGDMYRIGIGAAMLLILFPLFVLAIIAKFFLDRSRASQRMAESKRREADYHRMSQQVTEAKLAALQAQVEPHFLYNTLASVQALTEVDPAKAHEMTGHLIQYLRNALPKMRESVSTVGQEVELVRAYLSILQMRMGPRLAFSISVPESLAALPFPPLMLPSLVENAIKHGLEPLREGGSVHISADLANDRLRLIVSDTGRGFAETVGAGVGLANIRERLAALYGGAARLTLEANTPRGVVAVIEVPAGGTRAGAGMPPAGMQPSTPSPAAGVSSAPLAAPGAARAAAEPRRTGFWARAWDVLVVMERVWRISLYYIYLGLLAFAGIVAIAGVVGMAVGAIPVTFDDTLFTGPGGGMLGLAVMVVALAIVAAALAIVMTVIYALGFVMLAVAVFVVLAVIIGMAPVLIPIALVAWFIWWMARRGKAKDAPPAPAERVEPTISADAAPGPAAPEAGR